MRTQETIRQVQALLKRNAASLVKEACILPLV